MNGQAAGAVGILGACSFCMCLFWRVSGNSYLPEGAAPFGDGEAGSGEIAEVDFLI